MKKSVAFLIVAIALSGCAISQVVTPVGQLEGRQICIVQNQAVKAGFLEAYRQALIEKGYEVRILQLSSSSLHDCPITSTYTANWRWDMATYMAYAEIKVYKDGNPAGQATYDSRSGGANMSKFIKAEEKVRELVNELFPGRAGS